MSTDDKESWASRYRRRYDGNPSYGNDAEYLVARIARDRPDILQRMKDDEYATVQQAARDAGIVRGLVPADIRGLERLLEAWAKADLEDRRLFLALCDRELEAAYEGQYLNETPPPVRRMRPLNPAEGAEIPALERWIDSGVALTVIARDLGVTYRTLCRWRAGTTKPSAETLACMERLAPPAQAVTPS